MAAAVEVYEPEARPRVLAARLVHFAATHAMSPHDLAAYLWVTPAALAQLAATEVPENDAALAALAEEVGARPERLATVVQAGNGRR